jgi:hypothetical protein
MNKIFKFLVFILIVEILLGYALYIRNSTLESGHYISSTIKAWVKLKRKITEIKNTNITEVKKTANMDCSNVSNQNITFNIAGFNSFRNKLQFQTNLQFLNSFDSNKDYLIVIMGNSETYGAFTTDEQSRLHSAIQNKLRNKINLYIDDNKKNNNGQVYVVNLSNINGMISDHLTKLLTFSDIYKPDLAVFYTGGNEIKLNELYSDIIEKEFYSIKLNKFYSIKNFGFKDEELEKCLNKVDFINKKSFTESKLTSNVDNYIKDIFFKINKTLSKKSINFLFYIQPFKETEHKIQSRSINHKKIVNISIKNKNFINLNLINENLKLDYVDSFHTRSSDQISDLILKDIWKNYKDDIQKKITN